MKKYFIIIALLFIAILFPYRIVKAQRLERFTNSLPAFAAAGGLKAVDGLVTIGVFSDEKKDIDKETLEMFKNLKAWNAKSVMNTIGNKKIEVTSLNIDNISEFKGQLIWVLDAEKSLEDLKVQSENGVYTVGIQEDKFGDYLYSTFIYENKSDDPDIEKWRLVKLIVNCEISPLRYSDEVSKKKYFSGKDCK